MNDFPGMLQARVTRRRMVAESIVSLTLAPLGDMLFPPFTAGAHIDVHLPASIVRQYSLCGDPADCTVYRIAVLRERASRGGSAAVHDLLHPGETVWISPPRNAFPLLAEAAYSVLIAGGIGVTPMIAMCHELHRDRRPFELHYCARSEHNAAFLPELTAAPFASAVRAHLDDGPQEQRLQLPVRESGMPRDTHFFLCGPTGFMDFVCKRLAELGWPGTNIHMESFAPRAQPKAGAPFSIVLASTGQKIDVGPHETAADALLRAGVNISLSCEQGVCGTCVVTLLSGDPDHRDFVLTAAERAAKRFTPCCSRALSGTLVLDL